MENAAISPRASSLSSLISVLQKIPAMQATGNKGCVPHFMLLHLTLHILSKEVYVLTEKCAETQRTLCTVEAVQKVYHNGD